MHAGVSIRTSAARVNKCNKRTLRPGGYRYVVRWLARARTVPPGVLVLRRRTWKFVFSPACFHVLQMTHNAVNVRLIACATGTGDRLTPISSYSISPQVNRYVVKSAMDP